MRIDPFSLRFGGRLRGLLAGAALLVATGVSADDRDFVSQSATKPYLFVILDSSGSMNWQPGSDAWAPMNGDDPLSKMYQAKSALFRVLSDRDLRGTRWGFATYNQDELRVFRKHWAYQTATPLPWSATLPYPLASTAKFFGDDCLDNADADAACNAPWGTTPNLFGSCAAPRDLAANPSQVYSHPVLGPTGAATTVEWLRSGGSTYAVTWTLQSGAFGGDSISVRVAVERRSGDGCATVANMGAANLTFERVRTEDARGNPLSNGNPFVVWQQNAARPTDPYTMFDQAEPPSGTCEGVETNDAADDDDVIGAPAYSVKLPTVSDPAGRGASLQRGDFVPFDWRDETLWPADARVSTPAAFKRSNRDFVLTRLAPNFQRTSDTPADLRAAPYFADQPDNTAPSGTSIGRLPLLPTTQVAPILPAGSTPLGNSLEDFRTWFTSWKSVASREDERYVCRKFSTVLLTDGDETCFTGSRTDTGPIGGNYNPCTVAGNLFAASPRVSTYAVGFGLAAANTNFLQCVVDNGGTNVAAGGPGVILPQNEDDLVNAILRIVTQVRSGTASFSTAAVPSVQLDTADKVFVTEFQPLARSVWPSRIYAVTKPVLDKPANLPACSPARASNCVAWEAQKAVVDNQVKPSVADPVGNAANQRRVYYAAAPNAPAVPRQRHFLEPTDGVTPLALKYDLWNGLAVSFQPGVAASETAAETEANSIVANTLALKTYTPPSGPVIEYVLGDNFHSDPLSISAPPNNTYFIQNAGKEVALACTDDANDAARQYRQFAIRQEKRRRMLAFGANDGMLHLLDAGVFRIDSSDFNASRFDDGSGRELFAFMPRATLPAVARQFDSASGAGIQRYSVDGRVVVADALIDPVHDGTGSVNPPALCDRRWRTVLVGGLRDGGSLIPRGQLPLAVSRNLQSYGSGYYALDITQPDAVIENVSRTVGGRTRTIENVPRISGNDPPTCLGNGDGSGAPATCGPVAFGTVLWEFDDTLEGIRLDEDNNGQVDLALTWSTPNLGRIRVCTDLCDTAQPQIEGRYVAIFGGGYDWDAPEGRGDWLYIVDIETGQAIYKRHLLGAAPSAPAAIDTDFDGYLDRIYLGTLRGLLYRVDLVQGTRLPRLTNETVQETDKNGLLHSAVFPRIAEADFAPRVLFNATGDNADDDIASAVASTTPQKFFFPPSVFFVPETEKYALAFGTGEREDLAARNQPRGRFFVFLDDLAWASLDSAPAFRPLNRAALSTVDLASSATADAARNFLDPATGAHGWHVEFSDNERLLSSPLVVAGVVVFTGFTPRTIPATPSADCQETGTSRIFGVLAKNATGLLFVSGSRTRFRTVNDLVTAPFTEQGQTKNPPPGAPTGADDLPADQRKILEELKELFPERCKFPPGYRVDVKMRDSRGTIDWIAPIPLCVMETNFRELN